MRPDPTTGLDLISLKDSSVLIDSGNTSSTSLTVPVEVKNGLREILPDLDDRAIKQVWLGCKDHAPDCTVEEVLYFAETKIPALQKANNPAGMLIHAVPKCFEGGESSALAHYRQQQRAEQSREQQRERAVQQEAEERQAWLDRMFQDGAPALNAAREVLALRAARKNSEEAYQKLGRYLGTLDANYLADFLEDIQRRDELENGKPPP